MKNKTNILALLGLILLTILIYTRFIRSRTSKFLPLEINMLDCIVLTYICCIFLYIIVSLIRNKPQNSNIEKLVDWLYLPIQELDTFIRNLPIIKNHYHRILNRLLPSTTDPEKILNKVKTFYMIFWIIPRVILVTVLFVDVFLFHQLHYKYMVIIFSILLFLNRCIKYSLKNTINEMILELHSDIIKGILTKYYPGIHPEENLEEDDDDDDYPPTMVLPLDIFIKFQTESIVYRKIKNNMSIFTTLTWSRRICEKHFNKPLSDKDLLESVYMNFAIEKKDYIIVPQIELILKISVALEYYNILSNKVERIKILKILIYTNYLLCWLYVLIVSLSTLTVDLTFLAGIMDTTEPFSVLYIKHYYQSALTKLAIDQSLIGDIFFINNTYKKNLYD